MTIFQIAGPREINTYKGRAARTITDDDVRAFWSANEDIAFRRGCYVFGMRSGRGLTPAYVGKTTRNFHREALADNKVKRYQRVLANYRRGRPVLFFVLAPHRRGAPNVEHIDAVERFLIQTALRVNPEIANVQGTKLERWRIHGVIRSGKGKPSGAARKFRALFKLPRATR
jgi:hypothetical protein